MPVNDSWNLASLSCSTVLCFIGISDWPSSLSWGFSECRRRCTGRWTQTRSSTPSAPRHMHKEWPVFGQNSSQCPSWSNFSTLRSLCSENEHWFSWWVVNDVGNAVISLILALVSSCNCPCLYLACIQGSYIFWSMVHLDELRRPFIHVLLLRADVSQNQSAKILCHVHHGDPDPSNDHGSVYWNHRLSNQSSWKAVSTNDGELVLFVLYLRLVCSPVFEFLLPSKSFGQGWSALSFRPTFEKEIDIQVNKSPKLTLQSPTGMLSVNKRLAENSDKMESPRRTAGRWHDEELKKLNDLLYIDLKVS